MFRIDSTKIFELLLFTDYVLRLVLALALALRRGLVNQESTVDNAFR